jgi:replicative DNA helicase
VSRRDDFEELPPHDRAAERVVLGGMMLSRDAITEVTGVVGSGDFFVPAHQIIFETITELDDLGVQPGAIAVADRLRDTGQLAKVGGGPYLHTLLDAVPTAANAAWYAGLVREKSAERRIITTGQQLIQIGWSPGLDLAEKLDAAWRHLEVASDSASSPRAAAVAERLPSALDRIEAGPPPGVVPSGWTSLDRVIAGAAPGQLVTVGARPSVGKSVVLSNWAVRAALAGVPVLLYSLEMSEAECLNRILAAEARVSLGRMRTGALTEDDWSCLAAAQTRLADIPLRISDAGTLRPGDIRADLRRARRAGEPAGLVVIDYAQLMTSATRRDNNRQAEVSEITKDLKAAAKDHDTAVLIGAQLNRGPEMRAGHRPLLADLRDSGSFEQDSDVVILLYRDQDDDAPATGEIDLIVAKNRAGERRTVTLDFYGHQARCDEQVWSPVSSLEAAERIEDEIAMRRGLPPIGNDE